MEMLQRRIKAILLKEWDPIGIKDIPEADDEYDSYISPLYDLLISAAGEDEIFDFLYWIEIEQMGLPGNQMHTKFIAKKLSTLLMEEEGRRELDMLTFEWDAKNDILEIHGDEKGLQRLKSMIESVLLRTGNDHVHLMTGEWGGNELSLEKQCEENDMINHVKIFSWKDKLKG